MQILIYVATAFQRGVTTVIIAIQACYDPLMKKLVLLLILCLPLPLLAWNLQGHLVIAQIAYENLAPAQQAKVDALANRIFEQLPDREQQFLNHAAAGLSPYARTAALPDTWTKLSVRQLFADFHAPLPPILQPYAQDTTGQWHFMNNSYGARNYCRNSAATQNVAWAISLLQKAYAQTQDPNAQGLILILLTHFVGDIHQPLHVLVKTNWLCGDDGGGNGFCLKIKRGVCSLNLHKFWDAGLGYLSKRRDLNQAATDLQQQWPQADYAALMQDASPTNWAQQEFKYADFIYGTPENQKPSRAYLQQGRRLAQQQLSLSGYRLELIINGLIARCSQNS